MERTVGVQLIVSGAPTFREEVQKSAQSLDRLGTSAKESTGEVESQSRSMGKLTQLGLGAAQSFIGFTSAQAAIAGGLTLFHDLKGEIFGVQDALTKATAIMDGVTPHLRDEMLKTAQVLSVQFGMSLTDVVAGYRTLADAGLNAAQSIGALPKVVAFSKASLLDLATATTTAVTVQTAFGLRSQDSATNATNLGHVTDVLTLAADRSNASIQGISEAMTKAGPIGHALGMSIEDVAALLADMADKGLNGRRALMGFVQLAQELPKKSDELKAWGVSIFTASGALAPMSSIITELTAHFRGMTTEQELAAFASAKFSTATAKVLLSLMGSGPAIAHYDALLHHADGTTQSVAEKSMQSLLAQVGRLRAELLLLGSQGFDKLLEFGKWLRDVFEPALHSLGTIGATAAHALAPIGGALLAAGSGTAKVGIEGIAAVLNTLLGLLAKNKTMVEVLAAVFATNLVIAAADAAVAFAELESVRVAIWAMEARDAVAALVVELGAAQGASETLGVLWGRFGGVVAFGSVALAVAGVVTNLSSANDQSNKLVASLTAKPTGAADTLSVLRGNVGALGKELDHLYAVSSSHKNPLGFLGDFAAQIGDMGLSIIGKGNVIDSPLDQLFSKSKVAAAKKAAQEMIDTIRGAFAGIRAQLVAQAMPGGPTGTKELGPFTTDQLAKQRINGQALVNIAKLTDQSLGQLAQSLNLNLQAPTATWLPQLTAAAQKLVGLSPAAQDTAIAFQAVNTAATIGTTQITAYGNALDALYKQTFGAGDAQDALQSSLNAVVTSAQAVTKGGGNLSTSMTDTTDAAIALRGATENVVGKLKDKVLADLAAHRSTQQITDDIYGQIVAFQRVATAAGLPPAMIKRISDAMADVLKHPLKVDTTDPSKKLPDVKKALADLAKAKASPTVGLNDQATSKINALLAKIRSLGAISVTPTVNAPIVQPKAPDYGLKTGLLPEHGGVLHFADGGSYRTMQSSDPIAQIAPAGAWRVWAEPETGGEAYIPLSPGKRGRSVTILEHVAEMFGLDVVPRGTKHYANGGVNADPAGGWGALSGILPPSDYNLSPESVRLILDLEQYANDQLARLRASFGPLGAHPYVRFIPDSQMRAEYQGVTIYGSKTGSGDAIANGNSDTGQIQVNRDLIIGTGMPYESLRIAINKEWSQTVLPHFLNSDAKIKRYLDIIGYHYKNERHLIDDLYSGQAKVGKLTTTPADLFGYFAARSIGGGDFPADFSMMPVAMVKRLRAAGLIPGAYKDPTQKGIDFLAGLTSPVPATPLEQGIRLLAQASDVGPATYLQKRDGVTELAMPGGHRRFSDGGFSQSPKHEAQVAPAGAMRVWAEPETGGEAYIPLGAGKRSRSIGLLGHVAQLFGFELTPKSAHALVSAGVAPKAGQGGSWTHTAAEHGPGGLWHDRPAVGRMRFADGGVMHFAAGYVGQDIASTGQYEASVSQNSATLQGTASYAGALNLTRAANPIDPKNLAASIAAQNTAIAATLDQISRTYQDVSIAAGKSAADQLAASGLVGQAFDAAAQKIIADAAAEKAARAEVAATKARLEDEDYASGKMSAHRYREILNERIHATKAYSAAWLAVHDQIAQLDANELAKQQAIAQVKRTLQDDEFNAGKMSYNSYVALLHQRLRATKQYSAEWLAIMQQIQSVQTAQIAKVQTQFNSFQQPVQQQTDVVSALGGTAGVTGQMVEGFLANAVQATKKFETVTHELLSKGFDRGLVEQVMRAGPKALPFAEALLTLPVGQVNAQEKQLALLGAAAGASGVATMGNVDRSTHLSIGGVKIEIGGPGTGHLTLAQVQKTVHDGIVAAMHDLDAQLNQGTKPPTG